MTTSDMLGGYDRVVDQIMTRYAAIREMIATGNVVGAQSAMEDLARYHARQSLNMRNKLVRNGHVVETEGK